MGERFTVVCHRDPHSFPGQIGRSGWTAKGEDTDLKDVGLTYNGRSGPPVSRKSGEKGRHLMETLTLDVPAMYGDHHVTEVRRILLELPGVKDVYASSCFQVVEVTFDPEQTDAEVIKARLDEAGYLGDLMLPVESGTPASGGNGDSEKPFFRQGTAYQHSGTAVSFRQEVPYTGRLLWPCPGLGTLRVMKEEE